MWRVILISAIFISAFIPTGDATHYTCNEGFKLEETRCRQLNAGYFNCPLELGHCVVGNGYCVSDTTDRLPSSPVCEQGFILDNFSTVCKKTIVYGVPECSLPYSNRNGECVQLRLPEQVCQLNSDLPAGCTPRSVPSQGGTCFPGYDKQGDSCNFITGRREKFCQIGYTLDDNIDMCFSNEATASGAYCEMGNPKNNQCIDILVKPATYTCPVDSQNPTTLELVCYHGTLMRDSPSSDHPEGSLSCIDRIQVPPVLTCPTGFRPDNAGVRCESIDTVDAITDTP